MRWLVTLLPPRPAQRNPAEESLDDEVLDDWLTWAMEVTAELPPKKPKK
ncbi:hypothetical protein [Streptomyces rimosus]